MPPGHADILLGGAALAPGQEHLKGRAGGAELTGWLRERIEAVVWRGGLGGGVKGSSGGCGGVLRTGWAGVDDEIGGLRLGAVHEFIGADGDDAAPVDGCRDGGRGGVGLRAVRGEWSPPLCVLSHLVERGFGLPGSGSGGAWCVWVGRRVWPRAAALSDAVLGRSLFVDAVSAGDRAWAADVALRGGLEGGGREGAMVFMLVVVDGSGFDLSATRRLQLAAEAGTGERAGGGGSLGLVARAGWEASALSAAWTRWRVTPTVSGTDRAAWMLRLVRGKGMRASGCVAALRLEREHDGAVVHLSGDVGVRPGEASAGARGRVAG